MSVREFGIRVGLFSTSGEPAAFRLDGDDDACLWEYLGVGFVALFTDEPLLAGGDRVRSMKLSMVKSWLFFCIFDVLSDRL